MRNDIIKRISAFLFTYACQPNREFHCGRIAQVENISQNNAYAVWNNNSITDRLFQSKETGGISLHSRRRNARWEPCSAACTWGRFIRCCFSSIERNTRQRIPSPLLYNVSAVETYHLLSCLSLFIYLARRITTVPLHGLHELSLALRPMRKKKRKKRENRSCLKIIKWEKRQKQRDQSVLENIIIDSFPKRIYHDYFYLIRNKTEDRTIFIVM